MKNLLLMGFLFVISPWADAMEVFRPQSVFIITVASQDRVAQIRTGLHERVLALMQDKESVNLLPKNVVDGLSDRSVSILLGCIGFYFAVHEDCLKEKSSPAAFIDKCKSFLSDRVRSNEFLQEAYFQTAMNLAFLINVWNLYLPTDDNDNFITEYLARKEHALNQLLSYDTIQQIFQKITRKFERRLSPLSIESLLLQEASRGIYGNVVDCVKKEVAMVLEDYDKTWAAWGWQAVNSVRGYLPF